jgi:hypothetical protein
MTTENNAMRLLLILFALWCIEAVLLLSPGHLFLTGHEIDVLHAVDTAMRLVDGARQHIDFQTPLGLLAFEPIAWFLSLGASADQALLLSNLAVALLFVPICARTAASRMPNHYAIIFGVICIVIATGLVYGGTDGQVSMSLYYNRWCWCAAFVVIVQIMLPPEEGRENDTLDGIIIGICLSLLALIKVSFFVAMLPILIVSILTERNRARIIAIGATGLAGMVLATILSGGVDFWLAYVTDVNDVRISPVRPNPGLNVSEILISPKFLPALLIILAAIIGLRKARFMREGLLLLLLLPGLVLITYQNWGNDHQWLLVIGLMVLVWSRKTDDRHAFGTDAKTLFFALGIAALTLGGPSFLNIANSPVRHWSTNADKGLTLMHDPAHANLLIREKGAFDPKAVVNAAPLDIAPVQAQGEDEDEAEDGPFVVDGVTIPRCGLTTAHHGTILQIAASLRERGFDDKLIGYASSFNALPLSAGFAREPNRAPWFYGSARGLTDADYLVYPACPLTPDDSQEYVKALQGAGVTLIHDHSTPQYHLFALER